MDYKQFFLAAGLFLLWASNAAQQANESSVDATMKKIYAAYAGQFHGETHFRGIAAESPWITSTHEVTCTQESTWTGNCVGKTGDDNWLARYRYSAGTLDVEGETNGATWQMHYQILDPWFFDAENFGFARKWTVFHDGVEYEGVDEIVQMGKRGTIQRKVRETGSNGKFRFIAFEVVDRVE